MNYKAIFNFLLLITSNLIADNVTPQPILATYQADWLVVGAGPAGISAVAALLDASVKPENIIWVDDAFNVGALGKYYTSVPANSAPANFLEFVKLSDSLQHHIRLFHHLRHHSKSVLHLGLITDPLNIITTHFRQIVANVQGHIDKLSYGRGAKLWSCTMPAIQLDARNVILAIGAHPKELYHAPYTQRIPLEVALNEKKLKKYLAQHKSIAIFGSSHSAALAVKNLASLGCEHIVHVYKHKYRFRSHTRSGEIFPYSGLKGPVARWTRNNSTHPAVIHIPLDSPEADAAVATCSAIIDAIGFEPNKLPVDAQDLYPTRTNPHELGPHLYGIGIAFPAEMIDAAGNKEQAVGLLSFMKVMKEELPKWMKQT